MTKVECKWEGEHDNNNEVGFYSLTFRTIDTFVLEATLLLLLQHDDAEDQFRYDVVAPHFVVAPSACTLNPNAHSIIFPLQFSQLKRHLDMLFDMVV